MKKIICKECGEEKYNHGHGVCHRCYMRIQMRDRRKKFPDSFKEMDRKRWKGERREKNNKQRLERYYAAHEENKRRHRDYVDKNRQKIRDQQKEYYRRNLERIRARNREYNKRRDKIKEFMRLKEWEKNQPIEKMKAIHRIQAHRRTARKKNVPATLTRKEWEEIKESFGNKCAYCGEEKVLAQEHVIPLSRGGGYTKDNIVPACKSCNSKKGTKTAEEYFEYLKLKH